MRDIAGNGDHAECITRGIPEINGFNDGIW